MFRESELDSSHLDHKDKRHYNDDGVSEAAIMNIKMFHMMKYKSVNVG